MSSGTRRCRHRGARKVHEDLDVRKAAMNASVRNDPLSGPLCVAVTSYTRRVTHSIGTRFVEAVAAQERRRSRRASPPVSRFGRSSRPAPRARRSRRGGGAGRQLVRRLDRASPRRVEDRGSQRPPTHRVQVEGVEDNEPYVVEQHLSARCGRIERAHLLCSGFRPRDEPEHAACASVGTSHEGRVSDC